MTLLDMVRDYQSLLERKEELADEVKANNALILFDAAYECFVSEPGLARSIYEVEGAKDCAVEVCSFPRSQALPAPAAATPLCRRPLSLTARA